MYLLFGQKIKGKSNQKTRLISSIQLNSPNNYTFEFFLHLWLAFSFLALFLWMHFSLPSKSSFFYSHFSHPTSSPSLAMVDSSPYTKSPFTFFQINSLIRPNLYISQQGKSYLPFLFKSLFFTLLLVVLLVPFTSS